MHIARRASSGAFQQRDADALAALTGAIARGIRASLRFDAARRVTGADAPGMVVLGPHDEVELITASGTRAARLAAPRAVGLHRRDDRHAGARARVVRAAPPPGGQVDATSSPFPAATAG